MDMLLYFAFGALNIGLLYIISNWYKRETGIDLLPGRENKDRVDTIINIICYFVSGKEDMYRNKELLVKIVKNAIYTEEQ